MSRPTIVQTGFFEIPHVQHWLSSSLPRLVKTRNMGIHPIFSLFILSLVSPGDCLEVVPMGPVCARQNCCAEDTVCATKVSCPYWQV